MAAEHNALMFELAHQIRQQVNRAEFRVRVNAGRTRRSAGQYYIPDVMVIPTDVERAQRGGPGTLETYNAPLPLVVEIWLPSTGDYDVDQKLSEYRRRGDLEIWRLHPYERTLTRWVRQPDGAYTASIQRGGRVTFAHLPNVSVELDALFAE